MSTCPQHPAASPPAGQRCAWGWSCQNLAHIPTHGDITCEELAAIIERILVGVRKSCEMQDAERAVTEALERRADT